MAVSGAIIFTEIFINGPVPATPTPDPRILVLAAGGSTIPWATSSGAAAAVPNTSYGQQVTTASTAKTASSVSTPAADNRSSASPSPVDSTLATAASQLAGAHLVPPIF